MCFLIFWADSLVLNTTKVFRSNLVNIFEIRTYLHLNYNEEKLWRLLGNATKKLLGIISLGWIIFANAQRLSLVLWVFLFFFRKNFNFLIRKWYLYMYLKEELEKLLINLRFFNPSVLWTLKSWQFNSKIIWRFASIIFRNARILALEWVLVVFEGCSTAQYFIFK